ncbi:hypothetical protein HZS_1456 [Henneguya salminicola]|nr:hypothetical protein HZS_1456 [Henneguya salminicola]
MKCDPCFSLLNHIHFSGYVRIYFVNTKNNYRALVIKITKMILVAAKQEMTYRNQILIHKILSRLILASLLRIHIDLINLLFLEFT